jgi:hypothetical protein
MRRVRVVVPVSLVVILIVSIFFVPSSVAGTFGAELMQRFGGSSGSANGGSSAAPAFFGVPVTVLNQSAQSIPVTVQNSGSQPLTTTLQGTVSTNQENVPGNQPYQTSVTFNFGGTGSQAQEMFTVPAGKILVIRFVSGYQTLPAGEKTNSMQIETVAGGSPSVARIGPNQSDVNDAFSSFTYQSEVWVEADPGSTVYVESIRAGISDYTANAGALFISGYLLDPPAAAP